MRQRWWAHLTSFSFKIVNFVLHVQWHSVMPSFRRILRAPLHHLTIDDCKGFSRGNLLIWLIYAIVEHHLHVLSPCNDEVSIKFGCSCCMVFSIKLHGAILQMSWHYTVLELTRWGTDSEEVVRRVCATSPTLRFHLTRRLWPIYNVVVQMFRYCFVLQDLWSL